MSAVTLRESRGPDGWSEIGVYVGDQLRGIVTHPCTGARWFAQRVDQFGPRGKPHPTRKAAIEAVTNES